MKPMLHFCRAASPAVLWACAALCGQSWAQVDPAGAVQRSIEESQSRIPAKPVKPITGDLLDLSGAVSLDRLDAVEVEGERFKTEIQAYWKRHIGQPVSEEQTIAFKTWFYDLAKSNGFLAYAQTDAQGNKLLVSLVVPRVNSIRVYAKDEELAKLYLKDLNARFEADFKPGTPVDVLALEHKLDAVSFSMPLELDVIVRSAGPELLDLIVNVNEAPSRTGQVLGGLVQLNNYGLKQYGRAQVLGQVSVGGHSPTARATLTGQASEGLVYGRAEYDMPYMPLDARMRFALASSRSEGVFASQTRSVNRSTDLAWGVDKLLGYHREVVFKGSADLTTRQTRSNLSSTGAEISRVHDQQLRLRWTADSERLSSEPMRVELTAVAGNYSDLVGLPNVAKGSYGKLEFLARKQMNLSDDGQWFGLAKVRGQYASRHLDGYNQISLGGANGVRAYSTADGIGNDGLVSSLEINRRLQSNQVVGMFYDGGLVRPSKSAIAGLYNGTYSLQALGAQISGNAQNFYYNATVAKGMGGNKGALATDMDSRPNNWRLTVSGTYVF